MPKILREVGDGNRYRHYHTSVSKEREKARITKVLDFILIVAANSL